MISAPHAIPPLGFVVAMQATIIGQSGKVRSEWLIASRWSAGGACLSIARTLIPVASATNAPQHLVPRCSFLAFLQADGSDPDAPSFRFTVECPSGLRLAGRFIPAFGSARLDRSAGTLRLRGEIRGAPGKSEQSFQFDGVRVSWVGEFVETRS